MSHLVKTPWPVEVKKVHHSEGHGQHAENKVRDGHVQDENVSCCLLNFISHTSEENCKIPTKTKYDKTAVNG